MATSTIEKVTNVYGSNANGNYCKMPDGTLICWGDMTLNLSGEMSLVGNSGLYQTPVFNVSLPVNFVGGYVIAGVSRYSTGHHVPLGASPSINSQFVAMAYDFYKRSLNDGNYLVRWQAVGRWK